MWQFLLKAAVSSLLVLLLLWSTDLGAFLSHMKDVDRAGLVTAMGYYSLVGIPSAVRWSIVVGALGYRLGFRKTFPIVLIGYFFNLTLISSIGGDGVRMWEAYRAGLPRAPAISSVVIERILQLLAHLVLVAVGIAILLHSGRANPAVQIIAVLFLLASVVAVAALLLLDRLPDALRRHRYFGAVAQFSADMRRILLQPGTAAPAILLGFINQIGVLLVIYLLARSLSLPIGFLDCLTVIPVAMLATAIPISIAGWGVREGAFVAGFGLLGIPAADALALSVLFGAVNMVVRLPGALLWLARPKPKKL